MEEEGLFAWSYSRTPLSTPLTDKDLRVLVMEAGEAFPSRPMMYAIKPATWGVAIEVPEILLVA